MYFQMQVIWEYTALYRMRYIDCVRHVWWQIWRKSGFLLESMQVQAGLISHQLSGSIIPGWSLQRYPKSIPYASSKNIPYKSDTPYPYEAVQVTCGLAQAHPHTWSVYVWVYVIDVFWRGHNVKCGQRCLCLDGMSVMHIWVQLGFDLMKRSLWRLLSWCCK